MAEQKRTTGKQFTTLPFSQINREGAYVSTQTGRLFRVPPSAIKEGHSPIIEVWGPEGEEMVTFITNNPFTPIEKLRFLAAEANIEPTF